MTHDTHIHVHRPDPPRSSNNIHAVKAGWTEEKEGLVKVMVGDGNSFAEISAAIGKTKAAISRAVRRLNLELPPDHQTKQMMRARGWTGQPTRRTPIEPFRFRAEDFASGNVHGIGALEDHHCRFICNDDTSAPIYCGLPRLGGSKFWFCFDHHAICVGRGAASERAAG